MLELKNINVSFRSERQDKIFGHTRQQVLFDVSLAVKEGTCLGILGESGSGKSTMGRVLCGLLKPDSGEAVLDGVSVYASRAGRRNLQNKLSIVFQDYTTSANPRFRIRDIIGEGLTVQERREGKKLDRRAETSRLLELVGLPADFADRFPHELSGGQLQRVCIARAVACRPEIILFDEAISSLDAHTQVQVMDLLRELKDRLGLTYIFITHDLTSITYVELGSLGHWGEWHIKSEDGLVPMPDEAIRDEYAADYLAAFPTAKLLMRRPFNIAAKHQLGLYNDMTGEEKDTMEWLGWIAEGGWYGDEPHALSAMPTFWQDAPVGGEFTSSLSMRDMLGKKLPRTLRLLEASHMSFIGPKTASVKYAKGYNAVLKQLGYRLRVTELKLTPCADGVCAELTVANEGAAPFYWEWPVNLYVEDAAGSTLYTACLPLSLPKLMPGDSQKASVKLEGADAQELLSGGWKRRSPKHLTIGIVDPMTGRDAVRLAMKAEQKNGRTTLL